MFGFEYGLILSMFYVWFRVWFDTHYVLCLVSSMVWYSVCFMFGFEYGLIPSMFYVWLWVSFDTQYVLYVVSRYRLILDMFYITFQGYRLGVFIVIVYKAPVSLTSVFKHCCSPNLERADFDRQSFQYTWLNSYFFSSLRESRSNILSY